MDQIEFGFNLPTLIIGVAFMAAFASVLAVSLPFVVRDSFANRLRSVGERRQELRAKQQEQFQQRRRLIPTRQEGLMRAGRDCLALVIPTDQVGGDREPFEVVGIERCFTIRGVQ